MSLSTVTSSISSAKSENAWRSDRITAFTPSGPAAWSGPYHWCSTRSSAISSSATLTASVRTARRAGGSRRKRRARRGWTPPRPCSRSGGTRARASPRSPPQQTSRRRRSTRASAPSAHCSATSSRGPSAAPTGRPVPEQEGPRSLTATRDQHEQLRLFAADIAERLERTAPLVALVGAARAEPELAELLERLHHDRLKNLHVLIDALGRNGPLRLADTDALETVWALTSPELHQLLVRVRGWNRPRYRTWLTHTLTALLLTTGKTPQ